MPQQPLSRLSAFLLLALAVAITLPLAACRHGQLTPPVTPSPTATVPPAVTIDGVAVQTIPGIHSPRAITYDGEHIWVANIGKDTVTKMTADGHIAGSYSVGSGPKALEFDGEHIWVANNGESSVTKLNLDGNTVGTYPIGGGYTAPTALLYDGETHVGRHLLGKLGQQAGPGRQYP